MTIICATHFSDSSFNAVAVAAELARKHRQPLWLATVLSNDDTRIERVKELGNALELEAKALASPGLLVKTAVLHGTVAGALGRFCTETQARLLVVGDTNHRVSPVFAGTLDTLAHGIEVPLLVVRDRRPFQLWTRGAGPLKVMLALDHTWASSVARDWIKRLAEYGELDLVAAHVWWPEDEYTRRGLKAPPDATHQALASLLMVETQGALAGLPPNVKHRAHLELGTGHIAERLIATASEAQVDVFVLGTHPRQGPLSRLWSVSHHILADAPMSVACVPATEDRVVVPKPALVPLTHF